MAPLTRESLEVSTSIAEPTAPASAPATPAPPKQASSQMRADALSLEIPVKVHGSRVTQVVHEVTPHTEPFEEQTTTMIVFPQGAVLRMSTAVTIGQMLVVTNAKTRQDAICRVVKVRTFTNSQGYVEIEFSHPQPGYWGVNLSADAPAVASKPAPAPPPPVIQREEPKKEHSSDISWAPARSANPPVSKPTGTSISLNSDPEPVAPSSAPVSRTSTPASSFILVGCQGETQPPASSTVRANSFPSAPPRIEPDREVRSSEPPRKSAAIDFPAAPPSNPVPSLSMAELLGDELAAPLHPAAHSTAPEISTQELESSAPFDSAIRSSQSSFGSLSGGSTLELGPPKRAEVFGSLLDASVTELTGIEPATRHGHGLLIAISIFVVFAAVIGGAFYFRQELGLQKPDQKISAPLTAPASQSAANNSNSPNSTQPLAAQGTQPSSSVNSPVPTVTLPGTTVTVSANPAPTSATKSSVVPSSEPAVTPAPKGPSVTSDMLASTLNAHPVSSSHVDATQTNDAPSIDAAATGSNSDAALPDMPSSSNVASPPPPVAVPENPLKVGGEVKEPRLINIRQPIYPAVAKQAHMQGDAVISTQIDKLGNVVHMQVVSGPNLLRQSALDALKHWKYEPSTLNGQPVGIEMQVTVKFRM